MRTKGLVTGLAGGAVGLLVAGSVAWTAIPSHDGVIRGCYTKLGGVVRLVDPARGQGCHPSLEVPISWSQKGAPGPQGPAGADGSDGADGIGPSVEQLAPGQSAGCPAGGAAITDAAGQTAYVCNGRDGADGLDGQSFSGTFTSPNGEHSIEVSDSGIRLAHGTAVVLTLVGDDVLVRAANDATLEGGATARVRGGGTVRADGGQVRINSEAGCSAAARVGDGVQVNPATGAGVVVGGEPTVCVG